MTRRNPGLVASLVSAPFILCVVVLGSAALGRAELQRWLRVVTHKEPIALRKPLGAMDKSRLGDYRFKHATKHSASMEDSLGTTEYMDWRLEDTSVEDRTDPRRFVQLAVTYYTGGPNLVPHAPDVCYIAGGYEPKRSHENRTIDVPALGEKHRKVPVRVCTFVKTAIFDRHEPTVIYSFHANGEFTARRSGVRKLTHRIADKHAYFAKIEVSFGAKECQPQNLGREESLKAAAKLFNTVLPILLEEHWPDWEAVENADPAEQT